jgi:AraC family transcriptional regulator, melibiose operon regulatory protein
MPARHGSDREFGFQHPGFSAFSGRPDPMRGHRHNEVELAVFERGALVALYGGRQMTVPPDRLVVLWGAMPHRTLRVEGPTLGHGLRVPLHWVLQWRLPDTLVRRLLNFDVIVDPPRETPCSDLALVKHWVRHMQSARADAREIVLLEAHARLLRLAAETKGVRSCAPKAPSVSPEGGLGLFERILQMVSERHQAPLRIPELARALQVSRTHVMRHFRKMTGMTVLEYLTQHRVSSAQRWLTTTDMKIPDIAYESGFNSTARFYACFQRLVGQSPARYRRTIQFRWNQPNPRHRRNGGPGTLQ